MRILFLTKIKIYPLKYFKRVIAFTLAEILLALAIIATIAGLTIPPLMQSEQQAQFNAGAQTAYQMVAQAVETLQAQNGIVHVGPLDTSGNGSMFRNDFCNVLQCIRMDTNVNITNGGINYYSYKSNSINFEEFSALF